MVSYTDPNYQVGKVAALSMYIATLWIIWHVLIVITPLMVIMILRIHSMIDRAQEDMLALWIWLSSELVLALGITWHIRKKYRGYELYATDNPQLWVFTEKHIEKILIRVSIATLVFTIVFGKSNPLYILDVIAQGFGVIYIGIFLITRWWITKVFLLFTVLTLLISIVTIWLEVNPDYFAIWLEYGKTLWQMIMNEFNFYGTPILK